MYLNHTLIQYMHILAIILPIYCMCAESDYVYATHSYNQDEYDRRVLKMPGNVANPYLSLIVLPRL